MQHPNFSWPNTLISVLPFFVISLDRHTLVFSKGWTNPGLSGSPCLSCAPDANHLGGPSLDFLQYVSVVLGSPKLYTAPQMWSHQCWKDGMDQFSQSADYTLANIAQDVTGPLYCKAQCQLMFNFLSIMILKSFSTKLFLVTPPPACTAACHYSVLDPKLCICLLETSLSFCEPISV